MSLIEEGYIIFWVRPHLIWIPCKDLQRRERVGCNLLLVHKNLKDICRWVEPELYAEKVKAKDFHRYELGTILDILDANTAGAVTKDLYRGRIKIVMDAVQRLRNDYAHGNWDDLTTHIKQLRLVKVLESISVFLSELEIITNERGGYTL